MSCDVTVRLTDGERSVLEAYRARVERTRGGAISLSQAIRVALHAASEADTLGLRAEVDRILGGAGDTCE